MRARFSQLLGPAEDGALESLQIRLYRLACLATAVLCLLVVAPTNLVQNLPWQVHVGNVVTGLLAAWCYSVSWRGRHYITGFFIAIVALFVPVWFNNAGSDGSVSYYLYPMFVYPLMVCRGWCRWVLSIGTAALFCGILLAEYFYPELVRPFASPRDRLLDHVTGAVASLLALGTIVWLLVQAYEREREHLSEKARELARSESNYRAIFDSTSDALLVYDEKGAVLDVNTQMCEIYGVDRETALKQSINDRSLGVSPFSEVEAEVIRRKAFVEGPQLFRWRSRRGSGELFWAEIAVRRTVIAGQLRLISSVRDISARVRAEEALRTGEERLRLALASSNQGWFDLNVQTGVGTASGEYARILGREPVEFAVSASNWIEGVHPQDRATLTREFKACIADGDIHSMEYRRQTVSGDWKWIRSTGKIVEWDASGRPLRMTGTHTDITEHKQLEEQLFHRQRLEAVGTLAGGVAHDLNNVLTPMLLLGEVLREKLPDPADQALVDQIEAGARRGVGIVKQLLAFSRDVPPGREVVRVAPLIEEMMEMMRRTFPREIELKGRFGEGLWEVRADPIQLHQVLLNLCINARDAMASGGVLTVTAENREGDAPGLDGSPGEVVLSVSDTGHGIAPEILPRIFDPFFTTKGVGKGTGLGLSTVHGIVKNHGGRVTVASEVGKGSRFEIFLPASAESVAVAAIPRPTPTPVARGQRQLVLVVDDEPAVLQMTTRVLQHDGLEVIAAGGGEEALERFKAVAGQVQLVVTDIMMPGMDGIALVPRLLALNPKLKVIGVSGMDYSARKTELEALGFAEVLRKPYELSELWEAVHRHLPAKN